LGGSGGGGGTGYFSESKIWVKSDDIENSIFEKHQNKNAQNK
jgi:hypothetical protein